MAGTTLNGKRNLPEARRARRVGCRARPSALGAVDFLHHAHPDFHWTGVYELVPDNVLRLGPFVGAPTDHVFISVGKGVCGSAVAERRDKNVPDVSKEPNYLACSSSTRSELVVLIRKDEPIFAQIDIDSHEIDAFDAAHRNRSQESGRLARAALRRPPAHGGPDSVCDGENCEQEAGHPRDRQRRFPAPPRRGAGALVPDPGPPDPAFSSASARSSPHSSITPTPALSCSTRSSRCAG